MKINVIWFRRDLRLDDNKALSAACSHKNRILPLFIFDTNILDELPKNDARVSFIYGILKQINQQLREYNSGLLVKPGSPKQVWEELIKTFDIETVFINRDYEPYARKRDSEIAQLLEKSGIKLESFKDQVVFEPDEILKPDGRPYSVYTPYKNNWLQAYVPQNALAQSLSGNNFIPHPDWVFPSLKEIGFAKNDLQPPVMQYENINNYDTLRDYPAEMATTFAGPYLRFGVVSIRKLVAQAGNRNQVYLSELIWREFFMQILYHYPEVVNQNFNHAYDNVPWRNNVEEFERWRNGTTGYPLVDAGMRELNSTGFMHNRVRMVTAGFLTKHLLIDWRWGEAYFAAKLFDYELSSNNGNWQWAAGTGCDAAPYFRVFNPIVQATKFDPLSVYIKKWIPEYGLPTYPKPIVDHAFARQRAIEAYKKALKKPEK
jgi:deoxyribodipyrimidine photo-lyase